MSGDKKHEIVDEETAKAQVVELVEQSRWFEVMPYPDGQYRITTKDE